MEKKIRSSEYELIKIIAIFSICLGHSAWSIYHFSPDIPFDKELFIDIGIATTNWKTLTITILSYLGKLGNDLFMICSVWFLIGSHRRQPNKIIKMLANVWVISILFLVIFEIWGGVFQYQYHTWSKACFQLHSVTTGILHAMHFCI